MAAHACVTPGNTHGSDLYEAYESIFLQERQGHASTSPTLIDTRANSYLDNPKDVRSMSSCTCNVTEQEELYSQ
eukprot:scaffold2829_cov97-Skeletonema_menzelii.AAC.1